MKLTSERLRQMIKEELQALTEMELLQEVPEGTPMYRKGWIAGFSKVMYGKESGEQDRAILEDPDYQRGMQDGMTQGGHEKEYETRRSEPFYGRKPDFTKGPDHYQKYMENKKRNKK